MDVISRDTSFVIFVVHFIYRVHTYSYKANHVAWKPVTHMLSHYMTRIENVQGESSYISTIYT